MKMTIMIAALCCAATAASAWPKTATEIAHENFLAARDVYDRQRAALQPEHDNAVAATNRYLAARDVYAKKKVRTRVEYNKVTALYRAAVAARESYDWKRRGVQAEYDNMVALHKTYLTFFIRTIVPPPEYDHPYTGGTLEIVRIEIAGDRPVEMIEPCQKERIGCAQRTFTGCRVYIVGDEYLKRKETAQKKIGLDYDVVLRHEVAHCNGWPHDHPDGRAPDAAMVTP